MADMDAKTHEFVDRCRREAEARVSSSMTVPEMENTLSALAEEVIAKIGGAHLLFVEIPALLDLPVTAGYFSQVAKARDAVHAAAVAALNGVYAPVVDRRVEEFFDGRELEALSSTLAFVHDARTVAPGIITPEKAAVLEEGLATLAGGEFDDDLLDKAVDGASWALRVLSIAPTAKAVVQLGGVECLGKHYDILDKAGHRRRASHSWRAAFGPAEPDVTPPSKTSIPTPS